MNSLLPGMDFAPDHSPSVFLDEELEASFAKLPKLYKDKARGRFCVLFGKTQNRPLSI